jgi:hypothetical protein
MCEKCWENICICGYQYQLWQKDTIFRQINMLIKVLKKKNVPSKLIVNKIMEEIETEESLEERVKSLVFYGTGDEAYELFESTCHLCYNMHGLGEEENAETLYEWAKDQAEQSQTDAEINGFLDDFKKGMWG